MMKHNVLDVSFWKKGEDEFDTERHSYDYKRDLYDVVEKHQCHV